jgi:hypothetical protein
MFLSFVKNNPLIRFFKNQLESNSSPQFNSEVNTNYLQFFKNKAFLLKFTHVNQLQMSVTPLESSPSIMDVTDKTFEELFVEIKIKNVKPVKTFLFSKCKTPTQFDVLSCNPISRKLQDVDLKEISVSSTIENTTISLTSLKNFLTFFYFSNPSLLLTNLNHFHKKFFFSFQLRNRFPILPFLFVDSTLDQLANSTIFNNRSETSSTLYHQQISSDSYYPFSIERIRFKPGYSRI